MGLSLNKTQTSPRFRAVSAWLLIALAIFWLPAIALAGDGTEGGAATPPPASQAASEAPSEAPSVAPSEAPAPANPPATTSAGTPAPPTETQAAPSPGPSAGSSATAAGSASGKEGGSASGKEGGNRDAAKIQADERFTYNSATNEIIAAGNVRVTYKKVNIKADSLRVNLDTNTVFAEGNVVFTDDQDRIEANKLAYDLKKEKGEFDQVKTTYTGSGIKGKILVSGNAMNSTQQVVTLLNGNLTTCDLADPHYHLETSEITVYLEDRLVARRVSYYEGRRKLFTLPYIVIPLKKENQFELPKVGYSSSDGWFIKTTYNYYRNAHAYGSYFLDWYQLRGFGTGLRHNYDNGSKEKPNYANGTAFAYVRQNRGDDPDLYLRLDHQQKLPGGWSGSVMGQYDTVRVSDTQDQTTAGASMRVTQQAQAGRTDLTVSYQQKLTDTFRVAGGEPIETLTDLRDARATFNTTQRVGTAWSYSFASSFARHFEPDKTPYDTLGYQAQVIRDFKDLTLRVNAQEQFNPPPPSTDDEEPVLWKSYSRLPEVILETKRINIGEKPVPLQATTTIGRYSEIHYNQQGSGQELVMATRGDLTLRLTGLEYRLNSNLTANVGGSSSATYYEGGDYRMAAAANAGLTYRFAEGWSNTLRYNWGDGLGASPFYSLAVAPQNNVTETLAYSRNGVTADVSTGYNLLTDLLYDVNARVSLNRGPLVANGSVGVDPNTGTWRHFTGTLQYKPSETVQVQVGTVYDIEAGQLERIDSQIGLPITKLWRVDLAASFDSTQADKLSRGEVALTRDLHCREIKFRYDQVRGEIWFEFRIKALPSQLFRFGASESRMMFDPQGLGGLVNTTAGSGAVR